MGVTATRQNKRRDSRFPALGKQSPIFTMDIRQSLSDQFEEYGLEIKAAVLDRCFDICVQYGVDAQELVESWMAFSVSNNLHEVSLDTLAQMERKEFAKRNSKDVPTPKGSSKQNTKTSSVVVYNANKDPVQEDNILSAYCTTPKRSRAEKRSAELHTPEQYGVKKQTTAGRSPRMAFSPASFSPTVGTPSSKYCTRTNAGQTVTEWGSLPPGATWKSEGCIPGLRVSSYAGHGQPTLPAEARYMYERLTTKACVLNDVVDWLGKEICVRHGLEDPDHLKKLHSEPFIGVGHICCDANGRLNPTSVLLEGARGHPSFGISVPLKLTSVSSYAIFPGQVVAVEGTNPTGETLVAQRVLCDAPLPLPSEPLRLSTANGPLHVVVASGPFTQSDTMTYQPLEDLIMYVQEHQPHVVILVGPFIDALHPQVNDGLLAQPFNEIFENIVDTLMRPLASCHTEVVLVPSSRDVHHQPVYPTPPYVIRKAHPRLHLVPDPSFLDVNGILFGITATDVLMHIGREEVCNPPQGHDRLGRLASHLLNQRSMYPLYPPPEDLNVDLEMWDDHTHLPVTPHVMILPSDFRYFLKSVGGSFIVNPERLAKGSAGGTFVRMTIKPVVSEDNSLVNSICAQVVRI
ncbi:DNA polymerase alpha subunit B [Frankliniella fusca]|uniref:DNA polymerase alpha subunit B n=1 Tax=Frankliniella fusca TaxID=407009 RepID=A0AAE1H2P8_9NEOP|nr:DNA polymerase alpha subunit B [Frankliniella fusca]